MDEPLFIFRDIHNLILKEFKTSIGADEQNIGFYIVHKNQNFTEDSLIESIRKYNTDFENITKDALYIFNPDTKETQLLSDFVAYLNENGLGAWDSGEGDL